jgi:hypothetical protein
MKIGLFEILSSFSRPVMKGRLSPADFAGCHPGVKPAKSEPDQLPTSGSADQPVGQAFIGLAGS